VAKATETELLKCEQASRLDQMKVSSMQKEAEIEDLRAQILSLEEERKYRLEEQAAIMDKCDMGKKLSGKEKFFENSFL
jgi:hypothetical protein